jgi:RNA polymerase sigma factor (TIGR02999 family)
VADELDLAIQHAPEQGADVSELWSKAYPELRQLAHARLRRNGRHSLLETTGLVNEAYTRLAAIGRLQLEHRGQFFAYSARVMRSIILNLAREAQAVRHGGGLLKVTLSPDIADELRAEDDPLRIDDALCELAKVEPRLATVVEMRFFAGFTETEIAETLGLAERTIRRDWERARVLLHSMLIG